MDPFPTFDDPQRLSWRATWTAVLDSYDQRNDDLYYVVTRRDGGAEPVRFMARVWARPDLPWDRPAFAEAVRQDLAQVAATGRTNTTYAGKMV
jgi:hypothetical protein